MEQDALDQAKGSILKHLIKAGLSCQSEGLKIGKEIAEYDNGEAFKFLYQEFDNMKFKAKIAKTAEAVQIFVPELFPTNPDWRVNPYEWSPPEARTRALLTQNYINYSARSTEFYKQGRLAVQQCVTYGTGVVWTGYSQRKQMVQSVFDKCENIIRDPDAYIEDDIQWVARRRFKPRWQMLREYPDKIKQVKAMSATSTRPSDSATSNGNADTASDILEYWEVYLRVGLFNFRDGAQVARDQIEQDDSPRKYCVTEQGVLLSEDDWEIPFWRDDGWPCQVLNIIDKPGKIWAPSVLESGLPHQRALNWIYSLYLNKMAFSTRTPVIIGTVNGQGFDENSIKKILYGGQMEAVHININGVEGLKLDDYIKQVTFATGVEEFERFWKIVGEAFEKSTGLSEILYSGEGQRQSRSAYEAQMKDVRSKARLEDWKSRVEAWLSVVGKRVGQAARYLEKPEDIGRIFGVMSGQQWGFLMPPIEEIQKPIEDQMMQQAAAAGLPAEQAAQAIPQAAQQQAMMQSQQMQQHGGVNYEEWLKESQYSIDAGSMRKRSIDQQIDAADRAMNQVIPTLVQAGLVGPALALVKEWAQINGSTQNTLDAIAAAEDQVAQQQALQQQMAMMGQPVGQPGQPVPGPAGAPGDGQAPV